MTPVSATIPHQPEYAIVCDTQFPRNLTTAPDNVRIISREATSFEPSGARAGANAVQIFNEVSDDQLVSLANDLFVIYDQEEAAPPSG